MQKVIISGANGFVGSYTVEHFLKEGCEVLAIDICDTPSRLQPHNLLKYLKCDLSNPSELLTIVPKNHFDTFVHFAWEGSAGAARIDPNLQIKNALSSVECLKIAKELGCSRFVCAGSIMEYEIEAATHTQGSKPSLGYIYGMGKLLSHSLCKSVAADIGIDLVWPMITNAYGVGELSPRFVNTTLRKIINKENLKFTAGTQNYDFVYITDVAEAFYLISKHGKPFCEYIIGSGNAKPLKEFVLEMVRECGPDAKYQFGDIPFTGTNLPIETFDIANTKNDCHFEPKTTFAQGTKMTMEWLKAIQ